MGVEGRKSRMEMKCGSRKRDKERKEKSMSLEEGE